MRSARWLRNWFALWSDEVAKREVGLLLKGFPSLKRRPAFNTSCYVTLPFFQYHWIAWPGAKVTPVGEPCYGWPSCTVQRALVYVMQVNVYEKAVSRVSSSFRRRPYLCFYDGPRTRSFFSRRETFELWGTITSSIYMSVILWNNSNFKSFTCFNYSCYGCGSINSILLGCLCLLSHEYEVGWIFP